MFMIIQNGRRKPTWIWSQNWNLMAKMSSVIPNHVEIMYQISIYNIIIPFTTLRLILIWPVTAVLEVQNRDFFSKIVLFDHSNDIYDRYTSLIINFIIQAPYSLFSLSQNPIYRSADILILNSKLQFDAKDEFNHTKIHENYMQHFCL